jgi:poly(hydroxyalkanoate) granule-associated protein
MSTTTVHLNATEIPESRAEKAGPGVAHQLWLASLGMLALTGKGISRLFSTLVEQGKELEPSVDAGIHKMRTEVSSTVSGMGTKVKEVGEKVRASAGKAESAFDERVAAALQRLGVPTHDDLQAISRRLEEMASHLEGTTEPLEGQATAGEEQEGKEGRKPARGEATRRPRGRAQ